MTGWDERTVVHFATGPVDGAERGNTATGTALLACAMPVLAAIAAPDAGSTEVPPALIAAFERSARRVAPHLAETAVLLIHATAATAARGTSKDGRVAQVGRAIVTGVAGLPDLAPLYDACVACGLAASGAPHRADPLVYVLRTPASAADAITEPAAKAHAKDWHWLAIGFAGALMITVAAGGALWETANSARSEANRLVATALGGNAP